MTTETTRPAEAMTYAELEDEYNRVLDEVLAIRPDSGPPELQERFIELHDELTRRERRKEETM